MHPSNWRETTIGAIGRVVTGKTPPSTHPEYWGEGLPFLTPSDMDGSRRIDDFDRRLSPIGEAAMKRQVVPKGIGVSCIGWQMGKAVHFDHPLLTNQQINTVVPDLGIVDDLYLYYELSSRRSEFFRLGSGGSRTPILKKSLFEALPVILPPLKEQRDIARTLGAFDDKIELNREMNRTLEATAQAIFRSWFVDFDPVVAKADGRKPFGMSDDLAALFPARFVDSGLGPIPFGWKVAKLGDIARQERLSVHPRDVPPDTPYIGLEHMPRQDIALSEWGRADEVSSNKSQFFEDQILFGKLRPYFHKVGVAFTDGICSTDILVVSAKAPSWWGLILGHLSSAELVAHADASSSGTRQPRCDWRSLSGYPVCLPDARLATYFSELIKPMVEKLKVNARESQTLAALRDLLLPKLLSGEIRVAEAEERLEAVGA